MSVEDELEAAGNGIVDADDPSAQHELVLDLPEYTGVGENLCEVVEEKDPEYLTHLAKRCISKDEEDYKSADKYRKMRSKHVQMFMGEVPNKIANDEANITYVHLPYMTKAILLFHAKYQVNFFPASGDIVGAHSDRPEDQERMLRVTCDLNLRLLKDVPEYVTEHDQGGVGFLLFGSMFDVWYWDPIEERPKTEFIGSDDLVISYSEKFRSIDMSHIPVITWRKRYTRGEIEAMVDRGWFVDALEKLYPAPLGKTGEDKSSGSAATKQTVVRDAVEKVQGIARPSIGEDSKREILEVDMRVRLPGLDRERPVTVFVDRGTSTVLRLALREQDDLRDKERFDREMAAYSATVERMQIGAQTVYQSELQAHEQGVAQGLIPPETPAPMMQEPQLPAAPKPMRKKPWNRYSHYGCIPNPEGFYQFGLGLLLEGPNIIADDVMSRYVSAFNLSLLGGGMYSRDAKAPRGDLEVKLGEWNETNLTPEQLQKAFLPFVHPTPDPNVFKIEERMAQAAEEITADSIIGGATGLSGETATTTEIRSSNAMDGVSVIGARYTRARTNSLKNLVYILSQTMPKRNVSAKDPNDPKKYYEVTAEDYVEDFDVIFTADPNLASRPQKQRKAISLLQQVSNIKPNIFVDPTPLGNVIKQAAINVLRAFEQNAMADELSRAVVGPPGGAQPGMGGASPGRGSNGNGQKSGVAPGAVNPSPANGTPGAGMPGIAESGGPGGPGVQQ